MHTTVLARADSGSSERSPLLSPHQQDAERIRATPNLASNCPARGDGNNNHNDAVRAGHDSADVTRPLTIIGVCVLLIIILDIGLSLVSTGLLQVQEDIICQNLHYEHHQSWQRYHKSISNETDCKNKDVQSELSIIQSWQVVFDLFPGLVMAVPLGLVADRYGRSLVLGLSLLGITLSSLFSSIICAFPSIFPLRFVWFSALFNFIGGSLTVFSAMAFCIASDISSEEQRSTTFFYLVAVLLGGAVLSNPVTYWVMETFDTWPAVYTGLCLMAVATFLGFCTPETLNQVSKHPDSEIDDRDDVEAIRADGPVTADHTTNPLDSSGPNKVSLLPQALQQFQSWLTQQTTAGTGRFREFLHVVVHEKPKVGLLLICLLFTTFGRDAQIMLQQYVVAKFQWSWSKAGLLISVQSLCSLLLLVLILPAIAQLLLMVFSSHPQAKDLWLARASILVQVMGCLIIGLADTPAVLIPGVALQALGTGFHPLVRGIVTNLLVARSRGDDGDHNGSSAASEGNQVVGLLYSVIAFIETTGTMVANPLLAAAFRVGLEWGGSWVGLPFLLAAVLFAGALVIVGFVDAR